MKVLKLEGKQNTSRIMIKTGLMQEAAEFCIPKNMEKKPSNICVVSDSNVAALYLESLERKLTGLNIPVFHHIIPAGEEFKTLETVSGIYDTLSRRRFGRDDMLIALGGGVTGDVAGFAAATYMRGVRKLVQIPTTLLAQVDSSVGGKTGVDLYEGKNLVGAFRQPDLVLIDPEMLSTLPERIYLAGMAEVIKYGCISDPEILNIASREDHKAMLAELIERCIRIKIKVVEEDETEEGLRRILNFGHTVGHSVEKLGNYTELSHGEAVSIGMAAAVKLGNRMGITKAGCYEKLTEILKSFRLPVELTCDPDRIYEGMLSDKKKQGDKIHFVLIEDFGKTIIKQIPVAELKHMMKGLGD